ncbi:MAG: fibronectin type III domain-containing protein [Gammaproteobacteria bacterium]|nr:fibronectin type III domain-containing protein [Gammaproteobacteria bacterium]
MKKIRVDKMIFLCVLFIVNCTPDFNVSAIENNKKSDIAINLSADIYNESVVFDFLNNKTTTLNSVNTDHNQLNTLQQTDPASLVISGKFTGTWFDPTHDGEGISIEILDANNAVINWFTYDDTGNQAWVIGTGKISGNTISVVNAMTPEGGVFGSSFNPDFITQHRWGSLFFEFSDCHQGSVHYEGPEEFGSGSLFLQRLTSISGLNCDQDLQHNNQLSGLGLITGLWYNPTRDGEGFLIEILDNNKALAYWYTYDYYGNQLWILGEGKISGRTITVNNAILTKGGIFGPKFNPDTVERMTWGRLTFKFSTCKTASVEYESIAGFESGVIELSRLTSIENNACNKQPVIDLYDHANGTGSISLAWTPPDLRVDGTALSITDISEYLIYFGTSESIFSESFPISADYASSVKVTGLQPGEDYYMAVTTRDTDGLESSYLHFPKKIAR